MNEKSASTRVRFAPSPTGDLHVGGLRTALYNFLFARKTGGRFILRIEDTDRERNLPDVHREILRVLQACGLTPDEGPECGGEFGPYIQSQRLELYQDHARKLLADGHAYPCFCSPEKLQQLRDEQLARNEVPGHNHVCRKIEREEAERRMQNEPYVLRLMVPLQGEIHHRDLVWGDLAFPCADLDDQVLLKSDGYPTYHLANVVDDHQMQITHVIRGEEWLPSVPKHLLLYRFFGWDPPLFAHLPLILNEKRQKLSKREGAGSVRLWLQKGIPPEALVNYLALLGWHAQEDREFYTLPDLIQDFDIARVSKTGAVFDPVKLEWLSAEHLKRFDPADLEARARPFLQQTEFADLPSPVLRNLLLSIQVKLRRLEELPALLAPFSRLQAEPDEEAKNWLKTASARAVIPEIAGRWEGAPGVDAERMLNIVREVGNAAGCKGKDLWMPIRAALTGRTTGPELRAILEYIGPAEAIARLKRVF
jgi:glutamyl-tRNA synthetase